MNMANPSKTAQTFETKIGARREVRRSTSGAGVCNSHGIHPQSKTTPDAIRTRTSGLAQPHSVPFETASSSAVIASVRTVAPRKSKRPRLFTSDSGTTRGKTTISTTPNPPVTQKSAGSPQCAEITPAIGIPNMPPIPNVALMRATAPLSFSGGRTSRMMLIPTGRSAVANPCNERPRISNQKLWLSAATMQPTIITARQTSIIARFPNMSASLPMRGVATAPVSNVEVTSHEAVADDTPDAVANSGSTGTTKVCCSATTTPLRLRTPTTHPVRAFARTVLSVKRSSERRLRRRQEPRCHSCGHSRRRRGTGLLA